MGAIVAFANQKGGVGKTTSAVNIAAALGKMGKKILLVDMDPQGNATSGVGISKKEVKKSIYEVLIGTASVREAIIVTKFKNLSVIPSNIALVGAEIDLLDIEKREGRAKLALDEVRGDYDYIFIDCPPALSLLTVNAFVAADGLIIPMQCEYFALEGLSQLTGTVKKVRQHYNPTLTITGILLTMYNGRLNLTAGVVRELKKYYADKLFKEPISRSVRLSEAPSYGEPICYHEPYGKGALEYQMVAKELLTRI
ncbi:MAG: ParA family protein [Ruminococcaceae bacterium]|nr:ParA family protein [Oscillospiraceae bacterium]